MANPTTVQVKGLQDLGRRLTALQSTVANKIGQKATGAGARVIRDKAKAKAPIAPQDYTVEGVLVKRGNLPKKIAIKAVPKSKRSMEAETLVYVRGKRKDGYANRIGQLQEFGTVKMEANPFMRPAFVEGKEDAVQAIKETLEKELTKVGA